MPKRRFASKAYLPEAEQKIKVLVCMPAYNESATIGDIIADIRKVIPAGFDLLVIDDGSEDLTREACKVRGVKVISHIFNMGYGAAVKTAYKYAAENGYDLVIQLDADGQHDVSNILPIYERLMADDVPDIVIGSRFLKGAGVYKIPVLKRMGIGIFRLLILMAGRLRITDPTSGLQGIRRNAFSYYAGFNNFAVDYPDANMIIQMAMKGYKICEIPALMYDRSYGVGMHAGLQKQMAYGIKMLLSMFVVFFRELKRQPKVYYRKPK